MPFVYPIEQDYSTPRTNPYEFLSSEEGDECESFSRFIFCNTWRDDWPSWIPARDRVNKHIAENVLDPYGNLPSGTILYHGSLDPDLQFTKSRHTFFGIDAFISIWYTLELRDHLWFPKRQKVGYLYEFELIKPLKEMIFLKKLCEHPGFGHWRSDPPKIHPQVVYHGVPSDPGELGIEVTLNIIEHPDSLRLRRRYTVDLEKLGANRKKTRYEFDPTSAVK